MKLSCAYAPEFWCTGDRVQPNCDCAVTWPLEQTDGVRYWATCPNCGDVFDSVAPGRYVNYRIPI